MANSGAAKVTHPSEDGESQSLWSSLFGKRSGGLWRFVRRMALRAGDLGVASADIAGRVEDVADRLGGQVERLKQVNFSAGEMAISNLEIHEIAADATTATRVMHDDMTDSQRAIRQALDDVFALTEGVKSIEERLPGLQKALKQVGAVSNDIDRIARKTDLLALNAAIEAARAGEAGKGFAVVADEVQALSRQTAAAVTQIQTTIQALSGQVAQLIAESGAASGKAAAARAGSGVIGHAIAKLDRVGESIADVEMLVSRMSSAASENMRKCQGVVQEVHAISNLEEESQADMEIARGRAMTLLKMSEDLISLTAETGVETMNTPYINATLNVGRRIMDLLERSVDSGRITMDELFDEAYVQMPNIEPPKYVAAFTEFLEETMPALIEPAAQLTPLVVLCTVVDRNGYMPVHNERYSQPPTSDPVWNAKHSRHRIWLKDRTTAAANACDKSFILQTYRRNMGDHFQVLKDCGVPLYVRGRKWGVVRMCFRHEETDAQ